MIVVTGIDGSGTSAIVKALHGLGVRFEGPYSYDENHEHVGTQGINRKILQDLTGRMWSLIPDYEDLRTYPTEIVGPVPETLNWKDPRACFTLPVWREKKPKVIWVKRGPAAMLRTWLANEFYKQHGFTSREPIFRYWTALESYLWVSLDSLEIPFVVTLYEEWWRDKNEEAVREVLNFCEADPTTPEIDSALEQMRTPKNG